MIERPLLRVPLPPETTEQSRRRWGDFSQMNARWATSLSSTTHERLHANPAEWYAYHTLYREARKDWPADSADAGTRTRASSRTEDSTICRSGNSVASGDGPPGVA
jgi:hypothetical protein